MNMNSLLEIQDIVVSYGEQPIIKGFSTAISSGSFIGLIGPNGAGKTTLLLAISGQLKPDTGKILFNESDIYIENLEYKKNIGYVHDIPFFYPDLTAEDFMRFVAGVKGLPFEKAAAEINTMLAKVSLIEEGDKLTSELSFGMRKKLSIAAALLGSPKILFLDEALNGVDFESVFHIKAILKEYVEQGGTVFLSTHILEVVEKLCNRNLILKDGQLIADLNGDELAELSSNNKGLDLETYLIRMLDKINKP